MREVKFCLWRKCNGEQHALLQDYNRESSVTNMISTIGWQSLEERRAIPRLTVVYAVVQFYPWFKFYFLLFQNHYHILPYPKTKENKI